VRKVLASWEFKIFMIIILLASIMGAVSISFGLSLFPIAGFRVGG
jgi:hypothetical protein